MTADMQPYLYSILKTYWSIVNMLKMLLLWTKPTLMEIVAHHAYVIINKVATHDHFSFEIAFIDR